LTLVTAKAVQDKLNGDLTALVGSAGTRPDIRGRPSRF